MGLYEQKRICFVSNKKKPHLNFEYTLNVIFEYETVKRRKFKEIFKPLVYF